MYAMLMERLIKAKINKELIILYPYDDNDKCYVGYLQALNDKYYIYSSITPHGKYDGIFLRENNIVKIEYNDLYIQKLSNILDDIKKENCYNWNETQNLLIQIFKYVSNKHRIISIELLNRGYDDVNGFICDWDDEYCHIHKVSEYGLKDGEAIICLEDISRISFDSSEEIILETLYIKNYPSDKITN